ncbi:MAG: GntR family transcriptional regulator, partial [Ilumatobacteraceae bacterium]|nr:GntR family transcriptional regulator [Ilumatobacteraceae bacterium]
MRDLLLDIDRTHKQRSLEAGLRDAIRTGRLEPGDAVPSTRGLAADLQLARATVAAAYAQLVAEGYLAVRQGAPTRVAPGPWTVEHPVREPSRPDYLIDLIPGEPDAARFPRAAWLRCTREVLATAPYELLGYGDPSGLGELRAAIASYLNRTRNAAATAESTTVVPGAGSGLAQLARLLHRQGV